MFWLGFGTRNTVSFSLQIAIGLLFLSWYFSKVIQLLRVLPDCGRQYASVINNRLII